jgi:hypothetical protein
MPTSHVRICGRQGVPYLSYPSRCVNDGADGRRPSVPRSGWGPNSRTSKWVRFGGAETQRHLAPQPELASKPPAWARLPGRSTSTEPTGAASDGLDSEMAVCCGPKGFEPLVRRGTPVAPRLYALPCVPAPAHRRCNNPALPPDRRSIAQPRPSQYPDNSGAWSAIGGMTVCLAGSDATTRSIVRRDPGYTTGPIRHGPRRYAPRRIRPVPEHRARVVSCLAPGHLYS